VRAVVVARPGGPESLIVVDIPRPTPGPDEVVVEVEAVGVNPVDLGNRADPSWAGIRAPYVVGYELAGRVVDTGEPVWALLPVRGTRHGALAEQVAVPRAYLAPRPPELDPIVAAALPVAGCTALQVLQRMRLDAGSWVYVHGATGGVGHLLVQMARGIGVHVAAASRPDDRRRLEELGVNLWVDRAAHSPAATAAAKLGRGLDAVVDLVGGELVPSLPHVRVGGHAATIVDLTGDLDLAIDRNIDLHGVLMRPGRDRLYALSAEVAAGVRPTVAETYPLERVADAHRRLAAGGVGGKLVITI
jgi:NADPH:quinone reductase-like Zn-dependent oxidoreductase